MIKKGIPYSKIILGNYLYIPKDEIENIESLQNELTVTSNYDKTKQIKLYTAYEEWFGIPLYHYSGKLSDKIVDLRQTGEAINFNFTSEFWGGQKNLIDDFKKYYEHGRTGFIVQAKTGSGKTVCAIALLSLIGRRALVVVPRSNLVSQWVERILEHSDLKRNEIGIVEGSKNSWIDKKIVIGLVHSLVLNRMGKGFKNNFGVVVFDEVHSSVPPETFSPVTTLCSAKIRIAMSATLDRKDGLDKIFREHIGETYITTEVQKRMKATVIWCNFNPSSGYIPTGMQKLNRRGMLISRLAKNISRNMLIVTYITLMLKSNRRVLILSDRTWQLVILRKLLYAKMPELDQRDVGFFVNTLSFIDDKTGKVSKKKKVLDKVYRDTVAKQCKVILASYGMFALGSDIPELSGLIYATPHSTAEQSQGRIERFLEDKKQPVVVDIIDVAYKDTLRWAASRKSWYKKNNIEIKVHGKAGGVKK